jgi:sodium pump decarboxylase gamma subunit
MLQGLILMVVGVGIVSGFLGLLVVILTLSSKIIPRFNHILPDEQSKVKAQKSNASPDAEIAVAIAAAMLRQREQG